MIVVLAYFSVLFYLGPRVESVRAFFIFKVTRENAITIVHAFLLKEDPEIFNHCKVIFPGPREDSEVWGYVRDEGDHIKVMGWVCAFRQIFWVSKKTRRVDKTEIPRECYTSWDKDGNQTQGCKETVTRLMPG